MSVDTLLSGKPEPPVQLVPAEQRKKMDELMLRIVVNSADGDKVRINLPMMLVQVGLEMGMSMPELGGSGALQSIDFAKILEMVERGLLGKLVEVESADGDFVEIMVE